MTERNKFLSHAMFGLSSTFSKLRDLFLFC